MWSRSTDGGITFPVSGTIATVPVDRSLPYHSTAPSFSFRWTPGPTIAADPVDGTLYAAWSAYRQPGVPLSAIIYLAGSTDNGASWSEPVIIDTTQAAYYEFEPWVQVSPDHVVHVTYQAPTTTAQRVSHYYVQSTDRGATWSARFLLGVVDQSVGIVQGDFQATGLGGYDGSHGTILASWEDGLDFGAAARVGTFQLAAGTTPSPTPPPEPTHTPTPPPVPPSSTTTPLPPTATATPCEITFTDVQASDYFYQAVQYLYCHGVVSGYADNTFRPYNLTTRGQLTKIVVLAEGWSLQCPQTGHFSDVPPNNPFYCFVETAYSHSVISGYSDNTFRPGNNMTRGQLCKVIVLAEGWTLYTPPAPTFRDVPTDQTFYTHIETAYSHGIISGYTCGPGCLEFHPGDNATRGQICKIVYIAVTEP